MKKVIGIIFFVLLALLFQSAEGQDTTLSSAANGIWKGECSGCRATGFVLKLVEEGKILNGSIKASGTPTFGNGEKPLLDGRISGRARSFRARGDEGDMASVDLTLSKDGKTLSGYGDYRGSSFPVSFTRAEEVQAAR